MTRRINDAALALLVEGGVDACTFAAVAGRAGVERSTLYRRYGDRWVLMVDAILGYAATEAAAVSLGSFREDLRFVLERMADILASPLGPAVWSVGAALRAGAAPDHHARFWETRFNQIVPIVHAAKSRGELTNEMDANEMFAFAMGAVHFRMLVIGERVDPERIDQIVSDVCRLYRVPRPSVEMKPTIAAAKI